MIVHKLAIAGTLESSDALVEIKPGNGGLNIEIDSAVIEQFGKQIHNTVQEVLQDMEVTDATVLVRDRGAIDFVLRARVEAAVRRSLEVA